MTCDEPEEQTLTTPMHRMCRDGIETLQIPLADLSRAAAEPLRLKQLIAVVGASSTQAQQACIRLARVYGLQNVKRLID